MRLRSLRGIPFTLLSAALLSACTSSPPVVGGAAAPSDYGGRFVYPLRTEPATLNFVTASDTQADLVSRLVGDSLVDRDVDMNIVPRLAESWEFSDSGRVLTFRLHAGVRFHDGQPLTSGDVKFTYEQAIDRKNHALARLSDFLPVERIDTPDDRTVRVVYRFPYAPALSGWEMPILPRHLYEKEDFLTSRFNRAPIGSGPFRFVSWEPGRRIVLASNRDYWGGRPYVDSLELPIIPTQETTLMALLAGEIDYASLTPVQWDSYSKDPAFTRRFATVSYLSLFFYYIAWRGDGSNPFFSDPEVRRAMALALDREEYVRAVLHGLGQVSSSLFHPAILPPDPESQPLRHDPRAAAALFDHAGWRLDPKTGLRSKNGRPFQFTLLIWSGGEDHAQFSQVAQESLRRLGIDMRIERLDWQGLLARLRKGDFEAALSGTVPAGDPDDVVYGMLHSSQIGDGRNYAGFHDQEIDAWLEEGRRAIDPQARSACYRRIAKRVEQLQPYTYLFFPKVLAAMSRRVTGVEPSPRGLIVQYPGVIRLKIHQQPGG